MRGRDVVETVRTMDMLVNIGAPRAAPRSPNTGFSTQILHTSSWQVSECAAAPVHVYRGAHPDSVSNTPSVRRDTPVHIVLLLLCLFHAYHHVCIGTGPQNPEFV